MTDAAPRIKMEPPGGGREYETTGILRLVLAIGLAMVYSIVIDAVIEPLVFRFVRFFLLFEEAFPIALLLGFGLGLWLGFQTLNRYLIVPRRLWLTPTALYYEVGGWLGRARRYSVPLHRVTTFMPYGVLCYLKTERSRLMAADTEITPAKPARILLSRDIVQYPDLVRALAKSINAAQR